MPSINDYRNKFPSLKALDDSALIDRVAEVQGVSREDVIAHMGYKPKPRGILSAINDTVIEGANAVAGGVKSVGDFVAPGNPVSAYIDENIIKAGEASQSDVVKAEKARYRAEMEGAQGIGDEVGSTLGYVARNPVQSLAQAAGSFVLPGAAVKGGGMLASMAGAGAKGLTRAGLAGGAVAGAALSGGDAAGTAYDLVKKAGGTDEQAVEAARKASVLPAAIGAAGGVMGAEKLLAGGKGFAGGTAARALKTAGAEGLQEAVEEGVTQYEGQAAAAPYDPTIDPMKGVAGAATMGAVLGGATGGAVSLLESGKREAPKVDPVLSVLAAPSVDDAINAATAAVSAKPAQRAQAPAELPQMDADDRREVLGLLQVVNRPGVSPNVARFAQSRMDALLAPYRAIPAGEVTEMLPVADARELTDEERREYATAAPFSYRRAMERGLPQPEVTELLPTGDATEVEPIPVGDASEPIPAPEAYETLPVGEADELLPTPDATEVDALPAGEATELDVETIQAGDLMAKDGEPFTSKTGAQAKAYASGGGRVVTVPNHFGTGQPGYVVRPLVQARPNNTRGTNAGDIARAGGQRDADGRGSDRTAGVPDARPSDVLASPASPAGQGVDGAGAAGGAAGRADALTDARRDLRGAMGAIDRYNDEWNALYREGVAYFQGDGKARKLSDSAPPDIKERYARLKKQKGTLQAAYDEASARVQALTPTAAPAPAAAPAEAPAAPAPEVAKPRQLNGSDTEKARPLFERPAAAAPTLNTGDRITLSGASYTVVSATPSAVKLQGADGGTKMVATNSRTYSQIQREAAPAPAEPPRTMMKPGFDPEAWDKARADRIKASREAGNTHLDQVPAYVETMRGKEVYYVHDTKVRGRVMSPDSNGNVFIEWLDDYSQKKEGAVPMKWGKKTVMQTSLGPRDLKDYVVGKPTKDDAQQAPAPRTQEAAPTAAPATPASAAGTGTPGVEADGVKQPDRVKVMTRNGQNVYVERADLEGDKPRMRHFTSTGKSLGLIVRENLDPTGELRRADAKEAAENPLFNVIGTKDGRVFASEAAAARELSQRGLQETHEVAPEGNGFIVKRRAATPNAEAPASTQAPAPVAGAPVASAPAPLYASRPVTNAADIMAWAASQGFKSTLPAADLHVTVAYSREAVDSASIPALGDTLTVSGGKRTVEPLGDEGAVVLKFISPEMQARWKKYREAGASWDYESYTPHVTITYDGKGVDLSKVQPYTGPIELGAEKQEPLNVDKAADYKEAGEVKAAPTASLTPKAQAVKEMLGPDKPLDALAAKLNGPEMSARRAFTGGRRVVRVVNLKQTDSALSIVADGDGFKVVVDNDMSGGLREKIAARLAEVAAPATHKDPGEPAEPVTPAVVREAIKTAAENEGRSRSAMKADALRLIDAAMPNAKGPTDEDVQTYETAKAAIGRLTPAEMAERKAIRDTLARDRWDKRRDAELGRRADDAAERIGFVTIKVPGDGVFKILNSTERLAEFRKKVETSPGFKDRQPAPVSERVNGRGDRYNPNSGERFGVESGSGGKLAAFDNMVNEGDLEAASDYADAVGLELDPKKVGNATKVLKWRESRPTQPAPAPAATAPQPVAEPAAVAPDAGRAERRRKAAEAVRASVVKKTNANSAMVWQIIGPDGNPVSGPPGKYPGNDGPLAGSATMGNLGWGTKREAEAALAELNRKADEILGAAAPAPQPVAEPAPAQAEPAETRLTETDARKRFEWRDLGTDQGERTYALFFSDPEDNRGMRYGTVTKFNGSTRFAVDGGDGQLSLKEAKAEAERLAVDRLRADGYVQEAPAEQPAPEPAQQAAAILDAAAEPPKGKERLDVLKDVKAGAITPDEVAAAYPAAEPAKIEDVGEKIGGARKDRWKERGLNVADLDSMSESEGATYATKANVWKPDYVALADASEPVTAAMVKVVYDSLAAKPKDDTPQGRRDYVKAMQAVRKVYGAVTTPEQAKEAFRALRRELGVEVQSGIGFKTATDPEPKRVLFSVYKGRSDPFVLGYNELARARKLVQDGFPGDMEPWARRFTLRQSGGAGVTDAGMRMYRASAENAGTPLTDEQIMAGFYEVRTKTGKTVGYGATKADAESIAKAQYERIKGSADDKAEPERPHLDKINRTGLPQRIDRDVTAQDFADAFKWRGVEFGNWAAQDERQRLLNLAYDSLMDLAEVLNVPPAALSLDGKMGLAFGARGGGRFAAHYEPGKLVINMTKLRGAGSLAHEWAHALDHYLGELDRADAYQGKARGASGWYSQDRYTGVPQKRMVQRDGKWVNEERMRLENLRPELAQAIDAVMRRLYETPIPQAEALDVARKELARYEDYARDETNPKHKADYSAAINRAKQVVADLEAGKPSDRMARSSYAKEAQKLSGKSSDGYWLRPTEMFARAFESFIFDKLMAMGAKSDYLVHGVEQDRYADGTRFKGNPYPSGDERAAINAAFDSLVGTLKTRTDDAGNVALFSRTSRAPGATTGVPMEDARALTAAIREALPTAPPIQLHDSVRKAPETLRALIRKAGAENDVEAVYHEGEIHVFPSNISSIERMQFVVAHHEVRHHGLRAILGPQMGPAMLRMYASNANLKAAANAKMAAGLADTRILAVEEALADMPVEELQALNGWNRIVAAARQWLRNVAAKLRRAGLNTLADAMGPEGWTDNDIAALVQRAENVSRGGAAPYSVGGTVFQRQPGVRAALNEALAAREAFDAYDRKAVRVEDADQFFALSAKATEARDALAAKLLAQPDDGFALQGRTSRGRMVIVNGSAQNPGQWQLTRFDGNDEPWGDSQYRTKESAVTDFLREIDLTTLQDMDGAFSRADQTQAPARPEAARAVATGKRSPLTGKPLIDLLDAAGNRIETSHIAATTDEALENYRQRPARQAAARAAAPAPTYAMPERAAKAEGSNWRRVRGQEFTSLDEDDGYLYHVTSAPAAGGVREQGLVPNAGGMFGGFYANYSAGKVFLTERSGVSYWQEKVGQQLEAAMDNPPAVVVLRIPKDKIKATLQPDTVGSGDAGAPAYYSTQAVFSRSPGTAKVTAQDLVNSTGGVFDFNRLGETKQDRLRTVLDAGRPGWLGLLTRDQIADVYGKEIPPVKEYDQLTREMENQRSKIAQDADDLYNEWAKLPAETNDKLARLMLDATVYSVHPDAAFNKLGKPNDAERQQVHARLKAQYALMGKDAQAVYAKVRDFHKGTLEQLRDALEARVQRQVENGQAKAAALAKIRQAFDSYLKEGPYFPLSRFGDFIVVGTREADGERVVASYATAGEQAAAARTLEADGFTVKMKTAKTYSRETDGSAGKFIGDVLTTLSNLDMMDATVGGDVADLKTKLMDDVNQLFIKALPDLSYRKHFMHRKGTPGFSSDMMRGFASSAFHAASHIARLNHGDRMTFALQDAFTAIEQAPEGDFNLHSQVLNELTKRHDAALNPNTHPVAAMLNQVGFVMYLGLSPAAGLINMLQTVMVTMPHLGARYGFGKANASLATALTDITTGAKANAKNGWNAAQSTKLTAAERTMMSELQDEGVIDLTQAHDLSAATGLDTGNVARSKAAFAMARAMKIVGWTFHIPEVMNRQVTALSAYRLEMEKTGNAEKAKDAAREAIKRTHFDYASSNRARFMQGNVARVLLQFKQYSQNMTYLLGRAAYQALKGESPEVRSIARRQLIATFAVTWGMAGALGLPGLGTAAGLIGMLVGAMDDDDEPYDWKVEFRNLMADTFGKEAGEVLSHGIPRALLPWDISNRVSLGDLWFRDSGREGQSPREAFATDAANILGPTAGTVLGLYTAADHMARGNWSKAAESVVPKFLRDPLKAIREGGEGVTSYNGEPLLDLTGAEVAGRLLGFAPARASEMYEGKAAVMNAKTAIEEKRQSLISRMAKARIDKDADTAAELQPEIAAFNQRNPEFKITGATLAKAIMTRMKNRANTEDGILLPRTKQSLREIGRFAEVE